MERWFFIGIKGVGMSALAIMAQEAGYQVSGADSQEKFITDTVLEAAKIPILAWENQTQEDWLSQWNDPAERPNLVVVGAAFKLDHPLVLSALELDIPVKYYSEALAELAQSKRVIAVAGTHGKTTTTAMIARSLVALEQAPGYIIGTSQIPGLEANGAYGQGEWLVIEADDYAKSPTDRRAKFFDLNPEILLINNIEHDHPDIYPTLADCQAAFSRLIARLRPGATLITNLELSTTVEAVLAGLEARQTADIQLICLVSEPPTAELAARWSPYQPSFWQLKSDLDQPLNFSLVPLSGEKDSIEFSLRLPGQYNQANASLAYLTLRQLFTKAQSQSELISRLPAVVAEFQGVKRRFEYLGQRQGTWIIDDYAHHPTACRLTIEAARQAFPKARLIVAFQAHTFSRTEALLDEFSRAFDGTDLLVVTDIFASARETRGQLTTADFVAVLKERSQAEVVYRSMAELQAYLESQLRPDQVLITMGAGQIYQVAEAILHG
ncbi:MAG: UDP-N-acetylmuramate--alanine ligase [Candidatus Berkelbacteria bacterium Gr01-1014_85]|uniref:UDP-N-acetylmuramate--alanine ligase n=1 Tax=Candidatus Berkelbacteria bacterium Gr01-1014_85 TaxID=2017150 RepID=A0A554JAJ2_9BACT|nr:MAG: UDP-N-acetylmuramate--alanine ligase [Candidatus Berkelbacteria bacterium Gr01-1014_85]